VHLLDVIILKNSSEFALQLHERKLKRRKGKYGTAFSANRTFCFVCQGSIPEYMKMRNKLAKAHSRVLNLKTAVKVA
jgi:hypothetical protein